MSTSTQGGKTVRARTPRVLWGLSKLMSKIARIVYSSTQNDNRYTEKINKLKDKINALQVEQKNSQRLASELKEPFLTLIASFVRKHMDVITQSNKSVSLSSGQVGVREIDPSVVINEDTTEKAVIAYLLKHNKKYLRPKWSIDRVKILKDFKEGNLRNIRGLSVRHGEEGFISLPSHGEIKPEIITFEL